jgi:hypothetical protein
VLVLASYAWFAVRAGRRQELAAHLASLTAPAECARMAWAVALAASEA